MVFKHEKDFLRTFDLGIFQSSLFTRFVPSYRLKSDAEKEVIFQNYLKSIEEDIDPNEVEVKTADGYYKTKYAINGRKTTDGYNDKEVDHKRKKRKRSKFKKDFYKFQLKGIEDYSELTKHQREDDLRDAMDFGDEGGAFDNSDDESYLEKRKKKLKMAFQDDVRKMMKTR